MTTDNDFSAYMKELSFPELMDIVSTKRKEYAPEAITAAEAELENRGFSAQQIKKIRDDWEKEHSPDPYKANLPLPMNDKLMLLVFPRWFTWSHQNRLAREGYFKQVSQIGLWSFLGYFMYFFIVILSFILAYLCT
ncbi:MAG: hypothetical protein V2A54_10645 [Bacteroidota bacterium]